MAASDRLAMCCLISYKFIALWAEKHKHSVSCPSRVFCLLCAVGWLPGGFSHYCLEAGLARSSLCSSSGRSFLDRVSTTLRCTLVTLPDPAALSPLVRVLSVPGGTLTTAVAHFCVVGDSTVPVLGEDYCN